MVTSLAVRMHGADLRPAALDRRIRVGFVNLMPHAEQFEEMLLPQFGSAAPFDAVWIRMRGRRYSLDNPARIDEVYLPLEQAGPLDALVVTGAAVEHLPFAEVRWLDELDGIVRSAAADGVPILGLCWGALAVGHLLLGLDHEVFGRKVSGAYETDLLAPDSRMGRGLDDRFWTAHSRFAGFDESTVDAQVAAGRIRVLARAPRPAGTVIAESCDHSVVMHIGHPEYGASRLAEEYARDSALGRPDVDPPANVDLDAPICLWRSHSRIFFANWIELAYQRAIARQRRRAPLPEE